MNFTMGQQSKVYNELYLEMHILSTRVSMVEGKNLSFKKPLHENKVQETLHPPNDTLHAEILDLKSKQEEMQYKQTTLIHETKTHIKSWCSMGRIMLPPPLLQ